MENQPYRRVKCNINKGYVTRRMWYLGMNGRKGQWNLLEYLEGDSSVFGN